MSPLDLARTRKYTRYAAAAYCNGPLVSNFECKSCAGINGDYLLSMESDLLDTSGYIAVDETGGRILLVFRGTRGTENDITDISLIPTPMPGTPLGSLVHIGFQVAMESLASTFIPAIKALISNTIYIDYKIAVVGHSLGGAIASLATIKLNHSLGVDWKRIELYTYGQPRTGNLMFAKWFSQLPMGSARVVHQNDIIPHLAPGTLDIYVHHQNEVWLRDREGATRCKSSILEDPNCSYSIPFNQLSLKDHLSYFNITMGIHGC